MSPRSHKHISAISFVGGVRNDVESFRKRLPNILSVRKY